MDAMASWRLDRRILRTAVLLVATLVAGVALAFGAGHAHSAPVPRLHADNGIIHADNVLADNGIINAQ